MGTVAQMTLGNQAEHAKNLTVTRHRAADHIRKAGDDLLIKGETRDAIQGCRKDGVTVRCITHGQAGFIANRQRG